MYENSKIHDAKFLVNKLQSASSEFEFLHFFSAFATAAHSVLQYAKKETNQGDNGTVNAWFDAKTNASAILRLAQDFRNVNVHETALDRSAVTVHADFAATIEVRRRDSSDPDELTLPTVPRGVTVTVVSINVAKVVPGWAGPTDVLTLAQRIYGEVDSLVAEGPQLGFLHNP